MNKLFQNTGGNIFKLNEHKLPNQFNNNNPKPVKKELRVEKYNRILKQIEYEEFNEMVNWLADFFQETPNNPDARTYEELVNQTSQSMIIEFIDKYYDPQNKYQGLIKWKNDTKNDTKSIWEP